METTPAKIVIPLLSFALAATLASCSKGEEPGKGGQKNAPVPVTIAIVEQKNFPLTIQAMGNAESCQSVAIKAQVDGEIIKAHVIDGQEVRRGDPLFDLDDRRYRHRLAQLKANLERDLAQLEHARAKERRQTVLNKSKIASEENLALQVANRRVEEASVAADRAAIAEGEVQLAFTRIVAPISGVVGRILIQPGNLVKANDTTPLVVINQIDPMCISFTVAENYFSIVQENQAKSPLALQVHPNRENTQPIPATLLSFDNAIDRQTASIRMKARGDNQQRRLWPGMFVTLSLKLADRPEALVIPTQAIQAGTKGPFVYVVKPDKTVEMRPLTLAQEDKENAVISTGLAAGETIVTVGQWRLKPGIQVEVIQAGEGGKGPRTQGDQR